MRKIAISLVPTLFSIENKELDWFSIVEIDDDDPRPVGVTSLQAPSVELTEQAEWLLSQGVDILLTPRGERYLKLISHVSPLRVIEEDENVIASPLLAAAKHANSAKNKEALSGNESHSAHAAR